MKNNKQTAVEWLIEQLTPSISLQQKHIDDLKEKAKQMEKEQDKFTNAPKHDKKAIIEMMNELHPKEMIEVVEFIKSKIEIMENNKQTSIEWLIEQLTPSISLQQKHIDDLKEKAKTMHKKEVKNAWLDAWKDSMLNPLEDKYYEPEAEQYYNETFGGNNEQ